MKAYSIFDDYSEEAKTILANANVDLSVHPFGAPRPDHDMMKEILTSFECIIIGTSQKITEDMFENVVSPRIIATASVGTDHIQIPKGKKDLITVINTPKANARSVAEYTIGCALSCCKRLFEGNALYREGKNNKALYQKPEDLAGKTIGVIGAGNVSVRIMEYARFFCMKTICWTRNPNKHLELEKQGIVFTSLEKLAALSDVISVNLPDCDDTKGIVSEKIIGKMKESMIFISVSRKDTIDIDALINKAKENPRFYVCLDLDVNEQITSIIPKANHNILITPHIAGGTVETRKRMFKELAEQICHIMGRVTGEQENI